MSALSDLLQAHLPKGVTRRQIALAIDEDPRHDVAEKTVYPYFNGKHGKPELKTLAALADHVPGVTLNQLLRAAGMPATLGPYVPPAEAGFLTARQRHALDGVIRSMVEPDAEATVHRLSPAPGRSAPAHGGARAASRKREGGRDKGEGDSS